MYGLFTEVLMDQFSLKCPQPAAFSKLDDRIQDQDC